MAGRWRLGGRIALMAAGLWGFGCTADPIPVAPPLRGPALPLPVGVPASPSVTPAPFARKAVIFGPLDQVALYRRASQDILVLAGAGTGLQNASTHGPTRVTFDDGRDVFLYDLEREERLTLVSGFEVGGFAFQATFDGEDRLYFLGRVNHSEAWAYVKHPATGSMVPEPLGPRLGKPSFLAPVNAVARAQGGVTSLKVDESGRTVVFTTGAGGLYAYYPETSEVQALLAAELADMHAADADLDAVWGRFVVWEDTRAKRIFLLDRWTGMIDPLSGAQVGLRAAGSPGFDGPDPYHVVFTATLPDGRTQLMAYDLVNRRLEALALLNLIR